MVSVVAQKLKEKRNHEGGEKINILFLKQIQNNLLLALTAIFDSADPLNEGKISMKEYLQVCLKNGIEVKWKKKRNPKLIMTDRHQNGYQER